MDVALVQYINRLCRHLAITPARLHPHEVYLDPADATDPRMACLSSMLPLGVFAYAAGILRALHVHQPKGQRELLRWPLFNDH